MVRCDFEDDLIGSFVILTGSFVGMWLVIDLAGFGKWNVDVIDGVETGR